jgi:nucleoside-diphosphate-sugar epimerase
MASSRVMRRTVTNMVGPMAGDARKVLVAGASGVVGEAALRHFASLPGWTAVGLARRPPSDLASSCVTVDLADADACRAALSALDGVTHVVYAALYEKPGLLPGWFEQDQMDRNLTMLRNLFEALPASSLRHVSLLQGTKAYGAHVGAVVQPGREREPRHDHANFYWLQEDWLRSVQGAWRLTILRPQVVFGEALGSNMNAIPALGVYAALLKAAGEPLHLPGPGSFVTEAVDASLLARALAWAATSESAWNETFNITNGDVFTMRGVWPALAAAFGMEVGDTLDPPVSLAATMPAREAEWARLVDAHDLLAPPTFDRFVGQGFVYADVFLQAVGPPTLVSTIKVRQAGFADCVDTEEMFPRLIARLQTRRLLPPP